MNRMLLPGIASLSIVASSVLARADSPRDESPSGEPTPKASFTAAAPPVAAPPVTAPRFWVGAVIQGDVAFLEGGDVCSRESQSDLRYACFRADREQYLGVPEPGAGSDFALSYGTTRIALHVERPVIDNVTLGGRFGFAFGGGPTAAKGPAFLPLHLEARIAYFIGKPLSAARGLRGFVSVMGGASQVDASRSVVVRECGAGSRTACTPATNVQPGGPNPASQSLEAYKKLGQGFVGIGIGAYCSFLPASGVLLELRISQLFPDTGTTFSPSLAYVFNVP